MSAITPFGFRAPPAIKALLDRSADQSGRSINNQLLQYCIQGLRLDGFKVPKIKKQRPTGGNRQGVLSVSPNRKVKECHT